MACILIQTQGEEPRKVVLEAAAVTLGRGLESDIRLKDIKSSRRHCQIVKGPSGYEVLDLSSGNGTYVNGEAVKRRRLAPGDQIRIGDTLVTFIDGEPSKPSPARPAAPAASGSGASTARTATVRKSPGAGPAAEGGRPAGTTTRTGLPKTATGPTQKITSGVPVRKPPTQSLPAARPPTQSLDRPSTTALKKGITQRAGQTTRSTGYVSATQRFHAEARRKRLNPVAILIGLIVIVFGVVLGFILFGGGEDVKYIRPQFDRLIAEAGKAWQENRFDDALAAYEKARQLVEPHEIFKGLFLEVKQRIEEVKADKAQMDAVTQEFRKVKARSEDKNLPARQRWDEAKALADRVSSAEVPWKQELQAILKRLGDEIDQERQQHRSRDFSVRRNEIRREFNLASREKAEYSRALRAWREYLESDPGEENRRMAEEEIKRVQDQIAEAVNELSRKASRMIEDGKKDQAVDFLKQQRPRFENTPGEGALEKAIREVERK